MWLLVLVGWGGLVAYCDITRRFLPNELTLGAQACALVILTIAGAAITGASITDCLFGWLVALLLTIPAYVLKWLGAGDVKMLAAIGLLTGLNITLTSYAIAGLLALMLIFGGLVWRRTQPWLNLQLARIHYQLPAISPSGGRQMPFGALLAVGLIISLVMLQTGLLHV